ncbi:MAG: hypothetical protein J6U26_00085, partial [Lachnospiraceae bacterium]|nr:hypothetical protein [Lachnospiraceae bacterium]
MSEKKKIRASRYFGVVLTAALALLLVWGFTSPSAASGGTTAPVRADRTVSEVLKSMEDIGGARMVNAMRSIDQSIIDESIRIRESINRSIWESESVVQSMIVSSIEEENSIAASIQESIYESSVAQASWDAQMAVLKAPLGGSHLVPFEVSYGLDDTDIPYIRAIFSGCAILGNSRAKNASDCGIFEAGHQVFYMNGASVGKMLNEVNPVTGTLLYKDVAALQRYKTLFVMGLNDIGYYDGNSFNFKADYIKLVNEYRAINPYSTIYLSEILPVPDEASPYFWRYFMIPDFNARIREVCAETGCIYVSASDYADFKYINSADHAHYSKDFYFLWAQTMANQMHLYEDFAGVFRPIEWHSVSAAEAASIAEASRAQEDARRQEAEAAARTSQQEIDAAA